MKVKFLQAARDELRKAINHYNAQRAGLGTEFKEEVRSTVEQIKSTPDIWNPLSENIRQCRTHWFPYGVIYHIQGADVIIVAVAHLHREPDYWKDRLEN